MPRTRAFASLLLATALLLPCAALAHKVTVFAYVDGPNVVVDAFYSKSNKVSQGKIAVLNAATGEEYLRATTDEAGALTFPVPPKAMAAGADLRIRLVAGEGHQDEILVKAQEYAALRKNSAAAAPPAADAKAAGQPRQPGKASSTQQTPAAATASPAPQPAQPAQLDEAALARIVNQAVEQALDSRLAPVKRLLMESAEKGPGPTEIVGGIGYIVGLFGVAAFVASRRKKG